MKKLISIFVIVFIFNSCFCQIIRWDYSVRLHGGTSNLWLGTLGTGIMAATIPYVAEEDDDDFSWVKYMPVYDWMFGIPSNVYPSGCTMSNRNKFSSLPWETGVGDSFIGIEYRANDLLSCFGYYINFDYKNQGLIFGDDKYTVHKWSPGLGVYFKLADFTSKIQPVLEIGAAYDFAFKSKSPYDYDKEAFNSGFVGIASLGLAFSKIHTMFSIQYSRNFYNFFNEKYESNMGLTPFQGLKRNNSYIMFKITHFWKLY